MLASGGSGGSVGKGEPMRDHIDNTANAAMLLSYAVLAVLAWLLLRALLIGIPQREAMLSIFDVYKVH